MIKQIIILILFAALMTGEARAETFSAPLSDFAADNVITLRCVSGKYNLSIPIPERWKVKSARIKLGFTNSASLLEDISQLLVSINDIPVHQVKLNPKEPVGQMEFDIPVDLLKAGYNLLDFHAAQHYTKDCELLCSPNLWTNINLKKARLDIEYSLKVVPLKLSKVAEYLFDPKIFPQGEIHFITENLKPSTINIASITASGIARNFEYRRVLFSTSRNLLPDHDNVLIGNKAYVNAFLKKWDVEIGEITGPFIKIMHLPMESETLDEETPTTNPYRALLVLSGVTTDHVKLAAETLASMTLPYPGTSEMTIVEFHVPEIKLYSGKLMITPNKVHRFSNLDFKTHSFRGLQANPRDISFRLPPDFFIKQNQYANLTLNFSYGPGLRADSVLNLELNGTPIRAISLANPLGSTLNGYEVEIPTYMFNPGRNILRFAPILTPDVQECDLIQPESLFLTLFDNSKLFFPEMTHFVKMPDLKLFTVNGFPFTRWPDGFETMIHITNVDDKSVASTLNVIGLMTQKNGYPLFAIKIFTRQSPSWPGDIIVIGDIGTIPEIYKKRTPLQLTKRAVVPYPIMNYSDGKLSFALSKQISGIGSNLGLIMEFQSPYKQGRTVMVITSTSTEELERLTHALLEPSVLSQVEGGLVLIGLEKPDYKVTSLEYGEKYFTGEQGEISPLDYFLLTYPEAYYGLLALIILIAGLTLFYSYGKIRRRRLSEVSDENMDDDKKKSHSIIGMVKKIFIKPSKAESDEDD